MSDADSADDPALLANTLVQNESPLHCQEQTAGDVNIYVLLMKQSSYVLSKK